uniref:CASPASE_P20 domain-containing protein n=1 Tax=Macrostomum lignano TaxID=282301 RepID=A0A1I8FLE8_9PLAT
MEKQNPTTAEIDDFLNETKKSKELAKHGSFVCFLMAHGRKDPQGRDCIIHGHGVLSPVLELAAKFKASVCPDLAGKPKIFFVQACRGRGKDEVTHRGWQSTSCPRNPALYPPESDFLFCFPTTEGQVSYRDPQTGSVFVQTLCHYIERFYTEKHLEGIMMRVKRHMTEKPYEFRNERAEIIKYYCVAQTVSQLARQPRSLTCSIRESLTCPICPVTMATVETQTAAHLRAAAGFDRRRAGDREIEGHPPACLCEPATQPLATPRGSGSSRKPGTEQKQADGRYDFSIKCIGGKGSRWSRPRSSRVSAAVISCHARDADESSRAPLSRPLVVALCAVCSADGGRRAVASSRLPSMMAFIASGWRICSVLKFVVRPAPYPVPGNRLRVERRRDAEVLGGPGAAGKRSEANNPGSETPPHVPAVDIAGPTPGVVGTLRPRESRSWASERSVPSVSSMVYSCSMPNQGFELLGAAPSPAGSGRFVAEGSGSAVVAAGLAQHQLPVVSRRERVVEQAPRGCSMHDVRVLALRLAVLEAIRSSRLGRSAGARGVDLVRKLSLKCIELQAELPDRQGGGGQTASCTIHSEEPRRQGSLNSQQPLPASSMRENSLISERPMRKKARLSIKKLCTLALSGLIKHQSQLLRPWDLFGTVSTVRVLARQVLAPVLSIQMYMHCTLSSGCGRPGTSVGEVAATVTSIATKWDYGIEMRA